MSDTNILAVALMAFLWAGAFVGFMVQRVLRLRKLRTMEADCYFALIEAALRAGNWITTGKLIDAAERHENPLIRERWLGVRAVSLEGEPPTLRLYRWAVGDIKVERTHRNLSQ